jgi:hypothetical protein
MSDGKVLLLGTNIEDDAPHVDDRVVGKSRGGNYDEAKRTGVVAGCCFRILGNVKS